MCWKLAQSPLLTKLYCAPGNPGISSVAETVPIRADEIQQLGEFAERESDRPDHRRPRATAGAGYLRGVHGGGRRIFGPTSQAAELEGSKVFAKELMASSGVPTAAFEIAHDARTALRAAKRFGFPLVLKADGLAAGKGVLIPRDRDELEQAIELFFEQRRFGRAGDRVVVEEFLDGEEVSFIALCDGTRILPMASSKDYKRIGDGDEGPNTGGMGAHSPAGVASFKGKDDVLKMGALVMEEIMHPIVTGLAEMNRPFRGFLYAGLVLTPTASECSSSTSGWATRRHNL